MADKPSMKDVARAAGVSQPAVSYAYNHPQKISESQRKHIFETAKAIGYHGPNALGRSLRSGKIGAIGLMMMDKLSLAFDDPATIALLRGLGQSGEVENLALTLFPLNTSAEMGALVNSGSLAVRGLVDGLIITTLPDNHPILRQLRESHVPFVIVDSPKLPGCHFIGIDDYGAACSQMSHLLELGHRQIGILIDRLNPDGHVGRVSRERYTTASEAVVRERLRGYVDTAANFGLEYADLLVYEAGGLGMTAGQAAGFEMLQMGSVTGIIGTSDVMALACMTAAKDHGIDVPRQLSVIGFDDIPQAQTAGLTTVKQPMVEKGVIAAQFMRRLLNGEGTDEPMVKLFETRLVVRSSTRAV